MTVAEIIGILQACQASGVSSIKFEGLDVQFSAVCVQEVKIERKLSENTAIESIPVEIREISPEEEAEIKHKVEELTSIMKLSDNDLIDRMFPLPEQENEGVA